MRRRIKGANDGGDCFPQAWRYFEKHAYDDPKLRLVHALVTGQGPIEGIIYSHAWCEDDTYVYDMTQKSGYQQIPKVLYHYMARIHALYSYDIDQFHKKTLEYKTYGPWESELLSNPY